MQEEFLNSWTDPFTGLALLWTDLFTLTEFHGSSLDYFFAQKTYNPRKPLKLISFIAYLHFCKRLKIIFPIFFSSPHSAMQLSSNH